MNRPSVCTGKSFCTTRRKREVAQNGGPSSAPTQKNGSYLNERIVVTIPLARTCFNIPGKKWCSNERRAAALVITTINSFKDEPSFLVGLTEI